MSRLAVALLLLIVCSGVSAANAAAADPTIYVVNQSPLSDDLVQTTLPAFQAALDHDFAPAWDVGATLRLAAANEPLPPRAWRIVLANQTDVGALGYHSTTNGDPIAHVYVASAIEAGDSWEKLFSHELFEMLTDPYVSRAVWNGSHEIRLLEVCDPVQALAFAYDRSDAVGRPVEISDFVLPAWFHKSASPPYDFTRHVHHPGQLLPGGFINIWRHGRWHELDGPESASVTSIHRGS